MLLKSLSCQGLSGELMSARQASRAALKKFWPHGVGFGVVGNAGFGQACVVVWKGALWYW